MAIDVAAQCELADATQGSQTLAIVLSVMFSVYTFLTLMLTSLTIFNTSTATRAGSAEASKA